MDNSVDLPSVNSVNINNIPDNLAQREGNQNLFLNLPKDILNEILALIDIPSIHRVMNVCKTMRNTVNHLPGPLINKINKADQENNVLYKVDDNNLGVSFGNASNVSHGITAYMAAVKDGEPAVVKALLDAGEDISQVNHDGETALITAVSFRHSEVVNMLLDNDDIDVNQAGSDGLTALMCAVCIDSVEVVNTLIRAGADINQSSESGFTPLIIALAFGYAGVINLLLSNDDIDVNRADGDGVTPLIMAAGHGDAEFVNMLIDKGADIDRPSRNGRTALMAAVRNAHTEIVSMLIDKGVQVNHSSNNGDTALIVAVEHRRKEIVDVLIRAGADVNHPNNNGRTALTIAARVGIIEMVCALLGVENIDINQIVGNGLADGFAELVMAEREALINVLINNAADLDWGGD